MSRESLGTKLCWVVPGCVIAVVENLIGIVTLGYYVPSWQVRWVTFKLYHNGQKTYRQMARPRKEQKER